MKTEILDDPEEAARILRAGGLVAFPTETVYGLGGDATQDAVVEAIFRAKGRPSDNPLIIHLAEVDDWELAATELPKNARRWLKAFSPGPLTTVVPKHARISNLATAGLNSVGIRIPHSELALAMLKACRLPIAAPSANLSGRPSPTTWQAVLEDLEGRIDAILRGPQTAVGLESTVVECCSQVAKLLRPGAITLEMLKAIHPDIEMNNEPNPLANSPGLRHRHYQPKASVRILDHGAISFATPSHQPIRLGYIGISPPPGTLGRPAEQRICVDVADYAHALFDFFRHCDHASIDVIFCEAVEPRELGAALMDRLNRAAKPEKTRPNDHLT